MYKILFICHGNICRSPMAEFVMRDMVKKAGLSARIEVASAATSAEELGNDPLYREKFDVCVSRAVARLSLLNELCLPLVRVGGTFLPMKGQDHAAELLEAKGGIRKLGGELVRDDAFDMENAGTRSIMVIKKVQNTPKSYPRAFAKIKKSPLV